MLMVLVDEWPGGSRPREWPTENLCDTFSVFGRCQDVDSCWEAGTRREGGGRLEFHEALIPSMPTNDYTNG